MKTLIAVVVLLAILRATSASWAQPTVSQERLLTVSGSFRSGATMSGTIEINEGTGRVDGANIQVSGAENFDFNKVEQQRSWGYAYVVTLTSTPNFWPKLMIGERDSPANLKGYTGGPIGPATDIVAEDEILDNIVSGEFAPVTSY